MAFRADKGNEPNDPDKLDELDDGHMGHLKTQLHSTDWKISGMMIKAQNSRSYSSLCGWTAGEMWLEKNDWKSVAMEIL